MMFIFKIRHFQTDAVNKSKQIVAQVARQLEKQYGSKGFDERNNRRMMQFVQEMPDEQIVSQLATQLSWSHFVELDTAKQICNNSGV